MAKDKKTEGAPLPQPNLIGDCFVIVNPLGEWWTGKAWSADRRQAQRYADEPDPYRDVRIEAARLQAAGQTCFSVYIASSQAVSFFREI